MVTQHNNCKWFAVKVRTGNEQSAYNLLSNHYREYSFFLPKKECISFIRGAKRIYIQSLIPGYVLCQGTSISSVPLFFNIGNKQFYPVRFRNKIAVISDREMALLLKIAPGGIAMISKTERFQAGQHIRIIKGPLKNSIGTILFVNHRKQKIKVKIEFLGRSMPITLFYDYIDDC